MAVDHQDGVAPASNDAYTGMLSISLLALVGGAVLLYMDYSQYPDAVPPKVEKLSPDKKLAEAAPPKAVVEKKFRADKEAIELLAGKEMNVNVFNGKVEVAPEVDPAKMGVTAEIVNDTTIKIVVEAEPMADAYTVTIKSKDDNTATVKVTIKKEKKKEE